MSGKDKKTNKLLRSVLSGENNLRGPKIVARSVSCSDLPDQITQRMDSQLTNKRLKDLKGVKQDVLKSVDEKIPTVKKSKLQRALEDANKQNVRLVDRPHESQKEVRNLRGDIKRVKKYNEYLVKRFKKLKDCRFGIPIVSTRSTRCIKYRSSLTSLAETANVLVSWIQNCERSHCLPMASQYHRIASRSEDDEEQRMGKRELRAKLVDAKMESAAIREHLQRTMAALRVQEKRSDAKVNDINRLRRETMEKEATWDLERQKLEETIRTYERRDLVANLRRSQENEAFLGQQVEVLSGQLQYYEETCASLETEKERAVNEGLERLKTMQEELLSENSALKASLATTNDTMAFLSKKVDSLEMELAAIKKGSKISVDEKGVNGNDSTEKSSSSARHSQVARIGLRRMEWTSQETLTSSIRASVLSASSSLATNSQSRRASINRLIKTATNPGGQDLCAIVPIKSNLQALLYKKHRISEVELKFFFSELVVLIEVIRSRGRTYGHLEPMNVIIDSDGHVTLSTDITPPLPIWCGGQLSAVQMLRQKQPDGICDLWGLGVLAYEILTGDLPFGVKWQDKPFDVIKKIAISKLIFPETVSEEAQGLIRGLLKRDQHQRLGVRDLAHIKRHAFFMDVDWEEVSRKKVQPPFVPAEINGDEQE
ncbi:Ribosomal protein S6 kinase alpha-1 [Blyttiomyces sp. JEL0837]|nr:Ribosomal protein S6 kinase alpha-1 [Blyttiomyces sp. JEL0837]